MVATVVKIDLVHDGLSKFCQMKKLRLNTFFLKKCDRASSVSFLERMNVITLISACFKFETLRWPTGKVRLKLKMSRKSLKAKTVFVTAVVNFNVGKFAVLPT